MRLRIFVICVVMAFACIPSKLVGVNKFINTPYFEYLPAKTKLVSQTEASRDFGLYKHYSDTNKYRDVTRIDGIDDEKYERLLDLADRFSPILHRANFSVPRSFQEMLHICDTVIGDSILCDCSPKLYLDIWNLCHSEDKLKSSGILSLPYLGPPLPNGIGDTTHGNPDHVSKFDTLAKEFDPGVLISPITTEKCDSICVLYLDFAGSDEKSWKHIYENLHTGKLSSCSTIVSRIYAHPFIHGPVGIDSGVTGIDTLYEFVIQYWFFYPFNDGGNNHEGDWEHINVRITNSQNENPLLTSEEIRRILNPNDSDFWDSLIISSVEYYFHHKVFTLTYPPVDTALGYNHFLNDIKKAPLGKWYRPGHRLNAYKRANIFTNVINTHPIGYIAGDNKGWDQIFTLPGSKNRNSHGTYPYPGVWKSIGATGGTEDVQGSHKYPQVLQNIYAARDKRNWAKWYRPNSTDNFIHYERDNIILLPDWERIHQLLKKDSTRILDWAWMYMPIYWGFPVAQSPGAGAIKHADLGNSAPLGPAFNKGWNRIDSTSTYEPYDAYAVPDLMSVTPFDFVKNSIGFLNVGWGILKNSPCFWYVYNAPKIYSSYLQRKVYFKSKFLPEYRRVKFLSYEYGRGLMIPKDKFAFLLPQTENSRISRLMSEIGENNAQIAGFEHKRTSPFEIIRFVLHSGEQWSSDNSLILGKGTVRYSIIDTLGNQKGIVKGRLRFREFSGSLKWNFWQSPNDVFSPYIRGGFGWSCYRLENITLNNEPLTPNKTEWFHDPKYVVQYLLPNLWTAGIGIDLTGKTFDFWLFNNIGLRVEYNLAVQRNMAGIGKAYGRGRTGLTSNRLLFGLVLTSALQENISR